MPIDHERLREIFIAACDLPYEQQQQVVDERCAGDGELREQVLRLLRRDADDSGLFTDEVIDRGAQLEIDIDAGDATAEDPPQRIGRYDVKRLLGEGGMGLVWLAEQESPRRDVAIKVVRPGLVSRAIRRRFELEAALLGRLHHPGIAQVYEAGMYDDGAGGRPYFAMEYVNGQPLLEFVRSHNLSVRDRLEMFIAICDAVHHAHQRSVIHRDLKPANILVEPSGQTRILDFGVARVTDSDLQVSTLRTDVGQLIGTLPYMSPEQVGGRSDEIDTRSDVYALGVILYELLADRLPFDVGDQSIVTAARIISEHEPAPLTSIDRTYRGDLNTIVLKALEKDPDRRYQSASDLAADVRRYLHNEPIIARPASTLYQLHKFARRNRGLVAGVALTFVVLVGGVITTSALAVQISDERDTARTEADYSAQVAGFFHELLSSADQFAGGADATLRDALVRAADKIDADPPEHPRVEYRIRTMIGSAYTGLGLYDEAVRHLTIAVEKARQWSGPTGHDTALAMSELARLYVFQGRYDDAEQLLLDSNAIYEANPPESEAHRCMNYTSLATVCGHLGRYDDSETYARRALDIHERLDGYDKEEILLRQTLSGTLYGLGKYDEAEAIILEANEQARNHFSDSPGVLANGLNQLALVYIETGRREQALALHREVVDIQSKLLADDNPNLGICVLNLGMTLRGLDRFDEAEPEIRRAVDIFERGLSREHPYTLHALAALGNLLMSTDRLDEAEPILREVLDARMRVIGDDHRETFNSLFNLVSLLRKRGDYDAAVELIRPCVDVHIRKYGQDDWRTITIVEHLANNLYDAGRVAESEPHYREVYERRMATLGSDDEKTTRARANLIKALRDLDRDDDARRLEVDANDG